VDFETEGFETCTGGSLEKSSLKGKMEFILDRAQRRE
jgi:hypothetical protein